MRDSETSALLHILDAHGFPHIPKRLRKMHESGDQAAMDAFLDSLVAPRERSMGQGFPAELAPKLHQLHRRLRSTPFSGVKLKADEIRLAD